jgi:hypothetical protein
VSAKEPNTQADARRDFWMQQYATAFNVGDRRAAAVALQFAQQYNRRALVATPKKNNEQLS